MKKLHVTFDGVMDTTGYLFSFAKCLAAALRCSQYAALADDVVAASGFAFRMWVDGEQLCPSAASIWDFKQQKAWVENAGLRCDYVQRLWHETAMETSRRAEALAVIRQSIDAGTAVVVWDLSGAEWGLVIGYEEENSDLLILKIDGTETKLAGEKLGQLEIPILSVLAVTGQSGKNGQQLVSDTKKLAVSHMQGEEWCENACGLAAYDALIAFVRSKWTLDAAWNLEYMLGTYAALKWYAWKFFEKYGEMALAELYRTVHKSWQEAFEQRKNHAQVAELLQKAKNAEAEALQIMIR